MKKYLPALLVCCLAHAVRADVIFKETFNYFDGPIIQTGTNANGTTNWFRHNGSALPSDAIVSGHRAQIAATGGTVNRQDDVHRNFTSFTSTQTVLYASFTINCTNLPPAIGTYMAHFYVNLSTLHARVYAQAGNLDGTWRLGIASAATTVNKVFPVDLATNTDYQVVVRWNPVAAFAATLWVNPVYGPADTNVVSDDLVTSPPASLGFGLRQAGSFGNAFFTVSNLVVATTFDEAATNVWTTNAVSPIIVTSPGSRTNAVGDVVSLVGLAAGQGLAGMTYQWQKNGGNVANPNGNSNVFTIASATGGDAGNYQFIATTPYGLSATSAVALLSVPPTITSPTQAVAVTAFYHQNVSLQIVAPGLQSQTCQWYYTNAPATGSHVSGANTDTLSISDVFTNNGTVGDYFAVVSNAVGSVTSKVFTVTAIQPPAVSIAYLRTLVDPTTFNATNASLRWQATGTVTTFTNLAAGDSSYYLQDGTGGINIFVTGGQNFRPPQGASVTLVGWLSSFNSTLRLVADTNDLSTSFMINTNNDGSYVRNALPAPMVIPFNITNDLALTEKSVEGKIVMLTNVYFGTNAGNIIPAADTEVVVTNAAGERFKVFFSSQDLDTTGQTLPSFAWSVVGVFNQNLSNSISPRNQAYQVEVTRFSDIVTDPPPAVKLTIAHSGHTSTLTWPNVPWDNVNRSYGSNYSYSVLAAQSGYQAMMIGFNEVPANASTATGFGRVVVSPDGSKITVDFSFSGLSAPATAAHIHGPAGAGTNASVLFPFSGVPSATSGSIPQQTFFLTPIQAGYLDHGLLYMNVHNANFPGGEIRAQLLPALAVTAPFVTQSGFQANMLGVNEVPANGSTGTGFGTVVLSPDQTFITVNLRFSGLTAPATAARIHGPAGAGTNASIIFPFSGVPNATTGAIPEQTFAITPTQVGYLQSGQLYMNVYNSVYPGGELRDQIRLVPSIALTFANSSLTNTSPTTATYIDPAASAAQGLYRVTSP